MMRYIWRKYSALTRRNDASGPCRLMCLIIAHRLRPHQTPRPVNGKVRPLPKAPPRPFLLGWWYCVEWVNILFRKCTCYPILWYICSVYVLCRPRKNERVPCSNVLSNNSTFWENRGWFRWTAAPRLHPLGSGQPSYIIIYTCIYKYKD